MTTCIETDVLVAGSGPAGAATALGLARAGRRVLMLEKRRVARFNIGETLAPFAKGIVTACLGPLDPLPEWAVVNRGNVSVWGEDDARTHDFFFSPYGTGLCVNRDGFDEALRRAALAQGAELRTGAAITGAERRSDEGWIVTVAEADGATRTIGCRFLVDATGRAGALGRLLGYRRDASDPLIAYALRFTSDRVSDRDGFTRIEASPYGWWYSNRLPSDAGSERVVVLHSDPDLPEARQAASGEGFLALLAGTRLIAPLLAEHGYRPTGRVRGAPAGNARAQHIMRPGFLAVGDAAQALDPLSSQGLQQALTAAAEAGQALHYALANPADADTVLSRYAQRMQQSWDTYFTEYRSFYAMEPRWPEQPFWRARTASFSMNARDV